MGLTLAEASAAAHRDAGIDVRYLQAAILALLWWQVWVVDLDAPVSGATRIEQIRKVRDGHWGA